MTPKIITDFMVQLIEHSKSCSVLEPACGDGAFLKSLKASGFTNLTAYEIDKSIINPDFRVINKSFIASPSTCKYDVIIGNPPYIRWRNLEPSLKAELDTFDLWKTFSSPLCDYSSAFILKAVEQLKDGGELIFITPEYWITTTHAEALRNFLIQNGYLQVIYHFNETPIFEDARLSLVIFKFIKKSNLNQSPKMEVVKLFTKKKLTASDIKNIQCRNPDFVEVLKISQFKKNQRWILADEEVQKSIEHYENCCKKSAEKTGEKASDGEGNCKTSEENGLEELPYEITGTYLNVGNGLVSGLDKAFKLPSAFCRETCEENKDKLTASEKAAVINVIKAKHLEGYTYSKVSEYFLIKQPLNEEDFKSAYPNFYSALKPYRKALEKRYDYGRIIHYWQWAMLRNYKIFTSDQPRIFVPCKERITKRTQFRFTYVEDCKIPTQDVTALFARENLKESLLYVVALLNSSYVFNWLSYKGIRKGDIVEFSEKPVTQIPYRKIDFSNQKETELYNLIVTNMEKYLINRDNKNLNLVNSALNELMK